MSLLDTPVFSDGHKIMSSTCQTIHYDASQYRVYIPVIPKTQWQGPRCVLYCVLTAVYRPVSCPGTSLDVSVPPYVLSSHATPFRLSLAPLLPPYSARFLPSLFPSIRPCLTSSLPHVLPLLPPSPRCPCSLPPILHPASFLPGLHPRLSTCLRRCGVWPTELSLLCRS